MVQIKPFTGKARELTILIFEVLDMESPLNAYKIWRRALLLCKKRGLTAPYLHMLTRRVRYLASNGYLRLAYTEKKKEQEVKFYELSMRLRLAKWFDETSPERFVASVTEADATLILRAIKKRGVRLKRTIR